MSEENKNNEFEEYKPDPDKFNAEQEAIHEAHQPLNPDHPEFDETVTDLPVIPEQPLIPEEDPVTDQPDEHESSSPPPDTETAKADKNYEDEGTLDEDEQTWSFLSHLANVLFITWLWLPVGIYIYKSSNPKIMFQAKQAIIMSVIGILLLAANFILSLTPCCCLLFIPALILLVQWCYNVYITYVTFTGRDYRIPYVSKLADMF